MKGSLRVALIVVAVVCLALTVMGASVPQIINYQGRLMDKGVPPNPVTGAVNMTFSVYSSATGSNPLWSESWSNAATPANPVIVNSGSFNVMLGSLSPIPDTFFAQYQKTFLGIKIGTDSEMLPRQQFASVGYSFAAGNGIPKNGIIMWSGDVTQIPFGWALCNGGNGTPDLRDRFVIGSGNSYSQGSSGGSKTKDLSHSHATQNHQLTIDEMPAHNHRQVVNSYDQDWAQKRYYNPGGSIDQLGEADSSVNTRNSGGGVGHNHGSTGSGGNATQDITPPYYALAFIMKL